jgi:hypothetical protein
LRRKAGRAEVYAFNFDAYGRALRPRAPVRIDSDELLALRTTAVVLEVLRAFKVGVEDLTLAGLLPPELGSASIGAALDAAERSETISTVRLTAAIATLQTLRSALGFAPSVPR